MECQGGVNVIAEVNLHLTRFVGRRAAQSAHDSIPKYGVLLLLTAGPSDEALGPLNPPAGARQHAEPGARAVRRHRLHPARGSRVPRRRSAHRLGQHRAARRQSPGGGVGRHRHPGGGAEHRRGAAHPDQLQSGGVQQHHPRVQPRPRRRGRRPGHPGQGGPDPRAAAGGRARSRSSPSRTPTRSPSSGSRSRARTTTCSSSPTSATGW